MWMSKSHIFSTNQIFKVDEHVGIAISGRVVSLLARCWVINMRWFLYFRRSDRGCAVALQADAYRMSWTSLRLWVADACSTACPHGCWQMSGADAAFFPRFRLALWLNIRVVSRFVPSVLQLVHMGLGSWSQAQIRLVHTSTIIVPQVCCFFRSVLRLARMWRYSR